MTRTVDRLYRLHEGKIELQVQPGVWIVSAHDTATAAEIPDYERENHPVTATVKEKYGVSDAQPA